MPLDPQAKAFLDKLSRTRLGGLHRLPVPLARAKFALVTPFAGPLVKDLEINEIRIANLLTARVYRASQENPVPALIYFHGGGWVVGSLDAVDAICRRIAKSSECTVISVAYRLAPEHKFPVPLEDCYLAVRWIFECADDLKVDRKRIAVGGDSAGGNLAAAVCLLARDRSGPRIAFQLLIYPATDASLDSQSQREFAEGFYLTRTEILWFLRHYLTRPEEAENPLVSPLKAKSLENLPRACVITAEYDPLRDEGEAYATHLREAAVPVELVRFDGMIHGFLQLAGIMKQGETAAEVAASALKNALRR